MPVMPKAIQDYTFHLLTVLVKIVGIVETFMLLATVKIYEHWWPLKLLVVGVEI